MEREDEVVETEWVEEFENLGGALYVVRLGTSHIFAQSGRDRVRGKHVRWHRRSRKRVNTVNGRRQRNNSREDRRR